MLCQPSTASGKPNPALILREPTSQTVAAVLLAATGLAITAAALGFYDVSPTPALLVALLGFGAIGVASVRRLAPAARAAQPVDEL